MLLHLTCLGPDYWLDLADVAEYAGMTRSAVLDAVAAGELTAVDSHPRRPGEWLVGMPEVQSWAQRRRCEPPTARVAP